MKERHAKSWENLKKNWDKRVALERKRLLREAHKKVVEKLKAKRRRQIAKIPYARVLYLQKLKEDRAAMEAYKDSKNYVCESCGVRGLDHDSFRRLLKDVTGEVVIKLRVLEKDTKGNAIKIGIIDKTLPLVGEVFFCDKRYIMCHHNESGGFYCVCRWNHDQEDQRLRAEGKSLKAIDKKAIMVEVEKLLKETAGHVDREGK